MTSRLKLLFNSTLLNFLAIFFIVGNLSFMIFGNELAAQIQLLALVGMGAYVVWFWVNRPSKIHTSRWVRRCTCAIFWVTLIAAGMKLTMPEVLWVVLGAAAVTFIGFALNESYCSLAEVQKLYVTEEDQNRNANMKR